ncbi:hypothetical protein PIB30_084087 [Stylosanthes scabra]|uniref:Uncharacterized protein n=1 Tax=Stylosanthes scabra TaxID=79078 RepID=A0ABU6QS27_9FABA|nr:hypothetical protein [Stylosanthes scabra]
MTATTAPFPTTKTRRMNRTAAAVTASERSEGDGGGSWPVRFESSTAAVVFGYGRRHGGTEEASLRPLHRVTVPASPTAMTEMNFSLFVDFLFSQRWQGHGGSVNGGGDNPKAVVWRL